MIAIDAQAGFIAAQYINTNAKDAYRSIRLYRTIQL